MRAFFPRLTSCNLQAVFTSASGSQLDRRSKENHGSAPAVRALNGANSVIIHQVNRCLFKHPSLCSFTVLRGNGAITWFSNLIRVVYSGSGNAFRLLLRIRRLILRLFTSG